MRHCGAAFGDCAQPEHREELQLHSEMAVAKQTVLHDDEQPSRLVLQAPGVSAP